MNPLSASYATIARARRRWYERRPDRRRHLGCPVVSVGNLTVGGSGKTPAVAAVAELLCAAGYAPAILSRGYKRRSSEGVVVVSDREQVLVDVHASGDEPQMLARRLPGVPVVVAADRALAGTLAQRRFGADVLILDDGFQHLPVARTVDLLLMTTTDFGEQVLPVGRLREPIDAARRADAILVPAGDGDVADVARRADVATAFTVRTTFEPLRRVSPFGAPLLEQPRRVVAVAAIARPQRFFDTLRGLGFDIAREITFRDHHWFTPADARSVEDYLSTARAEAIVMTEKDAVRWPATGVRDQRSVPSVSTTYLPMRAHVEPADAFREWLLARLGGAAA